MSEVEIAKRGESIFTLSFRRLNGTVNVYVKAHQTIEELFKTWAGGISSGILDFGGRDWIFPVKPWPLVYDLPNQFVAPTSYGDGYYTISQPGKELLITLVGSSPIINISFLRLVGISSGLEFELAGVHSVSYLRDVQNQIQKAVKRLYIDYLLPIDLTASVVTQETKL